jgi:hypothetical protein
MIENSKLDINTPEQMPLPQRKKYQFRAVTYEVIAHFCSEEESLHSKLNHLLVSALQKRETGHIIAQAHGSNVE